MSKILVIEDEKNLRVLYQQDFERDGFEVVTATTAAEVVDLNREDAKTRADNALRRPRSLSGGRFMKKSEDLTDACRVRVRTGKCGCVLLPITR
jgi:DNA-binding NtrC family response regulator